MVNENCDTISFASSFFGKRANSIYTYRLPIGIAENSKEAEEYLGGKHLFNLDELEVYVV